ncbi:MAG: DNA polymerase III subunit gamma/tau [Bacteroides sp.]|nr:DNA polymerase III subunit gamma/tau [Bacteroides sp.]
MENYIVSARKYRPSTFESVVGQGALTTTLKNAIATGKLAHAYLFCGPRGVGKTTCARIFAKTINCLSPSPEGEACNHCESCTAFNEQRSYNIHELDAASNNSVDDIRLLVEQVRIPPQIGKYKVYIIDEVHMLSTSAFNAFLKTLEEPPHHAIFILATTEKHKILPTILSRCQIYDFNRISIEDTIAHLAYVASKEGIQAQVEALNVIALKADGGMRDALSIFDQVASFTGGNITYHSTIENLNVLDYEYYFRLTDCFLKGEVSPCLLLFNEVLTKGFDGHHFIGGLSSHLRDLLVSKDPSTLELLDVGAGIRLRYQEQAAQSPLGFLYQALKLANDCDLSYRASRNKRLLVELALIQIAQLSSPTNGEQTAATPPARPALKPIDSEPQSAAPQATPHTATPRQEATTVQPATAMAAPIPTPAPTPATAPTTAQAGTSATKGSMRLSIKKESGNESQSTTETQTTQVQAITSLEATDQPFDERSLMNHWQRYAAQLPQEETAIATQMKVVKPALCANGTDFEIVVENELAAKNFTRIQPLLLHYLRQELKNSKMNMFIRVSEATPATRAYTRVEKFQLMASQQPALQEFRETFGLEFS